MDGSNQARIFKVTNNNVVFKDIHFTRGFVGSTDDYGGAILGECTVTNCNFTSNYGYRGGAVAYVMAIDCEFSENNAYIGGAMAYGTAVNCKYYSNAAYQSAGAVWDAIVINGYFNGNRVTHNDYNSMMNGYTWNCTFVDWGPVYVWDLSNISLTVENLTTQVKSGDSLKIKAYGINVRGGGIVEVPNFLTSVMIVNEHNPIVYNFKIDSGKQWKVDLPVGNYTVYTSVDEFSQISPVISSINVTPGKPIIVADNFTTSYMSSETLNVTLKALDGTPISNAKLIVDIEGNSTNYTTDGDGTIYISIYSLTSIRTYKANILFAGDDNYENVNKTLTINITQIPYELVCNDSYELKYNGSEITVILRNKETQMTLWQALLFIDINGNVTNATTNMDGEIKIPSNTLSAGDYEIRVSYNGSRVNAPVSKKFNLTVQRQDTTLSATDILTSYHSDDKVVVTLINEQGNPIENVEITVDVIEGLFITNSSGQVEVPTYGLDVGTYSTLITFNGNQNYTPSSTITKINVTKANPVIDVEECSVNWGENATIKITITEENGTPISGVVKVEIYKIEEQRRLYYDATNETGKVQIEFVADLSPDTYNVKVTFLGDEFYSEKQIVKMGALVVKESAILKIDVSSNHAIFGQETMLTVVATDGRGQPITIDKLNVTVNDGLTREYAVDGGIINLGKLPVGPNNINISYIDSHYLPVVGNLTVIVEPAVPDVNVSVLQTNITVEAKDEGNPLTGTVYLYIDGEDAPSISRDIDETGKITISLSHLASGNHAVEVVFMRENYTFTTRTVAVYVPRWTSVMTVTGSTVQLGDESYITIKLTNNSGAAISGIVIVTVNWSGGNASDVVQLNNDGEGQANLLIYEPGTFNINAKFIGDDIYAPVVNDSETVTIFENNYNITFNAAVDEDHTEIMIGDAKNMDTGEMVSGIITGNIVKGFDEIALENATILNGNGTVKIPQGLEPGSYTVYLILKTDDGKYAFNHVEFSVVKYASAIDAQDVTTVTVNAAVEGDVVEYYTFTLRDNSNNILANKTVQIKVGGDEFSLTTNESGVAKFRINLSSSRTFNVAIFFVGDEKYDASFNQAIIKVNAQIPQLSATSPTYLVTATTKSISATLKDAKGNVLANKKVTFTVNGKTYKANTNDKGVATAKLDLTAANTYSVRVTFAGDSVYAASTVSAKVTLNKEKTKITAKKATFKAKKKTKKYSIILKSNSNKVIKKSKVSLKVNGKTFYAKTNAKGKATFKIKKLTKKAKYTAVIKFKGNKYFKPTSKKVKIVVK